MDVDERGSASMSEGRGFTRRDVMFGAATVGAGVLFSPANARASAEPLPRSDAGGLLSYPLGTVAGGVTRKISVARPVCLAAVRWSSPVHARLQLRARRRDGSWGPWGSACNAGHEGDGVRGHGLVGEGIWTGRSMVLQVRSATTVHGVTVQCVPAAVVAVAVAVPGDAVAGPAADLAPDALALTGPSLPAGPGQPPIIARREWAGSDHPPVAGPFYGTIEMAVVHHTENPNGYGAADVPAMLRAIYEFHVHGRGWFDIGYNFVIDRFGRIWEARQGGTDLPVIGAQAGDWNQISFGVSMLGTFSDVLPSPAALASLQRLLAWKLALNGVPGEGEIAAVVTPGGVSWTQFHVGEHVTFPRIAGHRQVDATSCPGSTFYDHLPAVRARVTELAGRPTTLGVSAQIVTVAGVASTLVLSGRLADGEGRPIGGATVQIQSVVGRLGVTRRLATVTTAVDGGWTASVRARAGLLVRALHAAAPAVASQLVVIESPASVEDGDVLQARTR
jgi:hypothetical protein